MTDPCRHPSTKKITSTEVHRWCRICGALYCFMGPIGWTWVPPRKLVAVPKLTEKQ